MRDHNEDCAAVSGHILNEGHVSTFTIGLDGNLLIVADGMGGHAKGEVASTLTVQGLNRSAASITDVDSCIEAVRKVNRELYDAMSRDEALRGMGTTVAGVVLRQTSALWFNVGDSRAYLYRGHLRQLTKDHVPQGDTAPTGQRSHAITQSLGGYGRLIEVWPSAGQISITPGDKLLLCSDGLTDLLSDEEIERHMREGGAPKCQSASKFDPRSASNFDPLKRRARVVALAPSELVGVAETAQLSFPVSMMSQWPKKQPRAQQALGVRVPTKGFCRAPDWGETDGPACPCALYSRESTGHQRLRRGPQMTADAIFSSALVSSWLIANVP